MIASPLRRAVGLAATALLLAGAAFYVWTGLMAIVNFGWRFPMFDQYRLYEHYLGLPFPENVLQLENGHRPIVPALLRVFEVWCCGANQLLQLAVGALLALATVLILTVAAWREPAASAWHKAAATLAAACGVFWLANARMLLHGNESVHAYLVTASVAAGGWLAWRAARSGQSLPMLAACLLCVVATFSFGPGIASFGAVFLVALAGGGRPRVLALPFAGVAAVLAIYLFVLPGDGSVRQMLAFDPLRNAQVALAWLGAPWIHGWLGTGQNGLLFWVAPEMQGDPIGRALTASAGALVPQQGSSLPALVRWSTLFGGIGVALWVVLLYAAWRTRERGGAGLCVALCLSSFGAGAALVIAVGRLLYFDQHPDQVFAGRYLVWPSVFWGGLLVATVLAAARLRSRIAGLGATFACLIVAIGLFSTQRIWPGWGAAVYRQSELGAIAANLGVEGPMFPDGADAPRSGVRSVLAIMRSSGLGPFRDGLPAFGTEVRADMPSSTEVVVRQAETLESPGGRVVSRFEGVMPHDAADTAGWILVLDSQSRVRGLGRHSFVGLDTGSLLGWPARKRGFDLLMPDFDPQERYVLAAPGDATTRTIGRLVVAP